MRKMALILIAMLLGSVLYAQDKTLKKAYFAGGCFWGEHNHTGSETNKTGGSKECE